MVNKLTAVIVAITTVIMSVTGLFVWGFAPEDETEFTPVIRFVACSDSHLKTAAGVGSHRLEKTAKLAYAIAKADDEYNNLDAFLINGDITNDGNIDQFAGFKVIADKYIKSETELLPIIANNHDFRNMKKQTVAYFSQLMGKDTDYHKVVNGYHFIGISTSDVEGVTTPRRREYGSRHSLMKLLRTIRISRFLCLSMSMCSTLFTAARILTAGELTISATFLNSIRRLLTFRVTPTIRLTIPVLYGRAALPL